MDGGPVFDSANGRTAWHSPGGKRHLDIQVSE